MNIMKRYISIVLILAMTMVSMTSGGAYAATDNGNEAVSNNLLESGETAGISEVKDQLNDQNGPQESPAFFKNRGIHDSDVEYYVNASQGTIFYDKKGDVSFVLPLDSDLSGDLEDEPVYWAFKESFVGGNKVKIKPEKESKAKYNLLIGDAKKHLKNVKGYKTLNYGAVYDFIDVTANINEMTSRWSSK